MQDQFDGYPVLDAEKTQQLRDALGDARHLELMAMLPDEARKVLQLVPSASATGDFGELWHAAHNLKGVAGNFGASRIAAVARAINRMDLEPQALDALGERLGRCVEELEAELNLGEAS